jgi:hypothetical protein
VAIRWEGMSETFLHYLYFRSVGDAASVGAELRARGFGTEERLSADGDNWLVLARHTVAPSSDEVSAARALMQQVARSHGGEYSGSEVDLTA